MAEPIYYQLRRAAEVTPVPSVPAFIDPAYGLFPYPHDYKKPFIIEGKFDGTNTIRATMIIQVKYLHDAIHFITGYAEKPTLVDGASPIGVARTLPIRIPMDATWNIEHWGMIARGITGVRVYGDTGKSGENAPAGYETYESGNAWMHQTEPTTPTLTLISPDDPLQRYWMAEIDIEFWHPPYKVESDYYTISDAIGERSRFTITTFVNGIEYASLPLGIIVWGDDAPGNNGGKDVMSSTGGGGKLVGTGAVRCVWHKVPKEVMADLMVIWKDYLGSSVNAEEFTFNIYDKPITFPVETLLFVPPQTPPEPKQFANGEIYYDIEYNFLYRKSTWNKMLHPTGDFFSVRLKNGLPLYESQPFSLLFNPYTST